MPSLVHSSAPAMAAAGPPDAKDQWRRYPASVGRHESALYDGPRNWQSTLEFLSSDAVDPRVRSLVHHAPLDLLAKLARPYSLEDTRLTDEVEEYAEVCTLVDVHDELLFRAYVTDPEHAATVRSVVGYYDRTIRGAFDTRSTLTAPVEYWVLAFVRALASLDTALSGWDDGAAATAHLDTLIEDVLTHTQEKADTVPRDVIGRRLPARGTYKMFADGFSVLTNRHEIRHAVASFHRIVRFVLNRSRPDHVDSGDVEMHVDEEGKDGTCILCYYDSTVVNSDVHVSGRHHRLVTRYCSSGALQWNVDNIAATLYCPRPHKP